MWGGPEVGESVTSIQTFANKLKIVSKRQFAALLPEAILERESKAGIGFVLVGRL